MYKKMTLDLPRQIEGQSDTRSKGQVSDGQTVEGTELHAKTRLLTCHS